MFLRRSGRIDGRKSDEHSNCSEGTRSGRDLGRGPSALQPFVLGQAHDDLDRIRKFRARADASFTIDEDISASSARAEIDASSIQSGSPDRDGHLRSPDFLDVERFPKITFASTALEVFSETEAKLTGDLTIKDITKSVTLDVELVGTAPDLFTDSTRVAFTATTKFDREDFGLTWNKALETGGVLVGKTVKLSLEVAAVKQ